MRAVYNYKSYLKILIYTRIWETPPNKTFDNFLYDEYYLVKNENNKYIGIVFYMVKDLHWLILPQYRKKGYLTTNLDNIILPHILRHKDKQRITIKSDLMTEEDYLSSKKVALNCGFKQNGDSDEYFLYQTKKLREKHYKLEEWYYNKNMMDKEHLEMLQRKIHSIAAQVEYIKNEVEMHMDESEYLQILEELTENIREQAFKIENYWYSLNEN